MKITINASDRTFLNLQLFVISATLAVCTLVHAISGYLGYKRMMGFRRLFDVGVEQSFTTYVSAINLLLAAVLLFLLSQIRRDEGRAEASFWRILSVLFLWLSIDESISIHEIFGNFFRHGVNTNLLPPILNTHE